MNEFITNDQLTFILTKMFSNIAPGKDFLVIQHFGENGQTLSDASIFQWMLPIEQPTPEEIRTVWESVKAEFFSLFSTAPTESEREVTRVM